eukprot:749806-Hanusia_phi.AAC.4
MSVACKPSRPAAAQGHPFRVRAAYHQVLLASPGLPAVARRAGRSLTVRSLSDSESPRPASRSQGPFTRHTQAECNGLLECNGFAHGGCSGGRVSLMGVWRREDNERKTLAFRMHAPKIPCVSFFLFHAAIRAMGSTCRCDPVTSRAGRRICLVTSPADLTACSQCLQD